MSGDRRRGVDRKKERLRALLYLAEQDTEAAKLLAAHNNHYAAYHCQQATTYRYATPGGRVPTSPEADSVAADAAHILALIADARSQLVEN